MEEISNHEEVKINIKELQGEPFDINLAEIEEVEGEFQKEVIHAPDEYSLGTKFFKALIDGITEGALKNLITISIEKIRIYKITQNSIKFLSCFNTPFEIVRWSRLNAIGNKSDCSIQVFHHTSKNQKSTIMRLNPSTGALLDSKEVEFSKDESITKIQKPDIVKPKNTKIESFVGAEMNSELLYPFEIGKLRKYQFTRFMSFFDASKNQVEQAKERFEHKKATEFRKKLRKNFYFDSRIEDKTVLPYSRNNPDQVLIIQYGYKVVICFLVDLRRKKVLKSASFTILDFFDEKEIDDILNNGISRWPEE